jgi:hypothetical protein
MGTGGRAIAQADSRWLPTAVARVRARVWSCGFCGGQSDAEAGFLRVLRFPLPIFISPIAPQSSSSIIRGWYNRRVVAAVPNGLSLTPLRIMIKNKNNMGKEQENKSSGLESMHVIAKLNIFPNFASKMNNFFIYTYSPFLFVSEI